ncbi:response regulator [Denitrobaculum tricleocarpae]|uniref:Response regulator n=1 Tax=Denitrobaculum tricleocarpae TaxID=2591009 RepID=A0A545TKY3_9PROT|nr:response regulator [Denitrobaculum tricleocarpae]TQV77858.1 response regulator [Denitrobaculum tricleocarpae]
MQAQTQRYSVLMVDDDPEDGVLVQKAIASSGPKVDFQFVASGAEVLDYLFTEGRFTDRSSAPRPNLILLDLNMPGVDGFSVLKQIKSDMDLRRIPVVVLTTSEAETDIVKSYDFGANTFITKPSSFSDMIEVMTSLKSYWFDAARLPTA